MKKMHILINEPFAKAVARLMKNFCYLIMLLYMAGCVLSLIGRQTFVLHTGTGTYNRAIYSEENHDWTSRGPTISMKDEVQITADSDGEIDLITQIGLSAMCIVHMVPLIISFWYLSRLFNHISQGRIFIEKNASCLLYYGLIQMAVAVLVPFIKSFISNLANQFADSRIYISTGQNLLNNAFPNIAVFVAAYIIHYGVRLQDEVEHTL